MNILYTFLNICILFMPSTKQFYQEQIVSIFIYLFISQIKSNSQTTGPLDIAGDSGG